MLSHIIWTYIYYLCFAWVHTRMKPAYLPTQECRVQRSADVPVKMISMLHGIITACYGLGYCGHWVSLYKLYDCRDISTAFLLFDFVQSVTFWKRDGDESSLAHPYGVGFHHAVTFVFMCGLMFNNSIAGCLVFFLSEIPVIFLNVTWLYFYLGKSETRECTIFSFLTILTYFIFRIVMFPLIFFVVLLPEMNLLNPFAYIMIVMLGFIYLLNCYWFSKLLTRTAKLFSNVQYFAVPAICKIW